MLYGTCLMSNKPIRAEAVSGFGLATVLKETVVRTSVDLECDSAFLELEWDLGES